MQVESAIYLVCAFIVLIGVIITVYGDRKDELFCLITGPAIMVIGLGLLFSIVLWVM